MHQSIQMFFQGELITFFLTAFIFHNTGGRYRGCSIHTLIQMAGTCEIKE